MARIAIVISVVSLAACDDRQANGFLEMSLTRAGSGNETQIEIPIASCEHGFISAHQASVEGWRVDLDEEQGGVTTAVTVTSPDGTRLEGVLDEEEEVSPTFSGSGTAELRPQGEPDAEPSIADLSWLCG